MKFLQTVLEDMPAQKKSAKFLKQKQAPVGQYTNFKIMKNYNTNCCNSPKTIKN